MARERDAAVTKLSEVEATKEAAIKSRQQYRDSSVTHLREIIRLEGLLKSKDEATATLEGKLYYLSHANAVNVIRYGAKADGKTDSTKAFLKAWTAACGLARASTMYVPKGRFLLNAIVFRGPCRNRVTVQIDGTLVAPSNYWGLGNSGYWILFIKVNRLSVSGGTIDAKGAAFWACRRSGKRCPVGARSITFNWVNDAVISGLTSINSQQTHFVINSCNNVVVRNLRLIAPDQSPNTDGIHVQGSTGVTIAGATLRTGDDCISIGPATKNLHMTNINCGPGHGVSIGSLGKDQMEGGVENVTLTNAVFTGSDNGVRIKSWARPSNGFVRNIVFQNLIMNKVKNPIIIDQNYCPSNKGCPRQSSGVKISEVSYRNIRGTSATKEVVRFDCSASNPCRGIRLHNINLTFLLNNNVPATAISSCKNIAGTTTGVLIPRACIPR
ncbi:polygalacturonase [Humulus lupulus]|uniref:polygalacturonase n=1 Tax=Humulus lupulus TaxID=3486 RepID=UPI002B413722|nr:polygalacturonase [Humulus lupulus]